MAKGNDGKAARQRTTKKLLVSAICALALVLGVIYFGDDGGRAAGSFSSFSKTTTGQSSSHRRTGKDHMKDGVFDDDNMAAVNKNHRHQKNNNKKDNRHNIGNHRRNGGRNHNGYGDDGGGGGDDEYNYQRPYKKETNNRQYKGAYGDERQPRQENWRGRDWGGYDRRQIDYNDGNREYYEPPQGGGGRREHHHNKFKKHPRGGNVYAHSDGGRGRDRGGGGDDLGGAFDDHERDEGDPVRPRSNARKDNHIGYNYEEEEEEEPVFAANVKRHVNKYAHKYKDENKQVEEEESQDEVDDINDELADQYYQQLISDAYSSANSKKELQDILNGSLNLVSIEGSPDKSTDGSYDSVIGSFCKLNFSVHKKDPSNHPMFRFLVAKSPDCQHPTQFNLKKVAYLARQRDKQINDGEIVLEGYKGPKVLNLTAVAFHESRCGSTLVANSMIAMDPTKHRTYSESPPPSNAYRICGDHFENCSQEQAAAVLRDSIYLMSRTDDSREERVFFKFQSITSRAISTFQMAFPTVPWMYVYREPVQVMMSHVKDDPKLKKAICTRSRNFPPKEIKDIAERHGKNVNALNPSEYCASHLAMLTESAVNNLNEMAIPVAYDQLPSMMWEQIMPAIFGRPLTQTEIDNLTEISKSYSKGGSRKDKKGDFVSDSAEKEKKAPEAVREAAEEYLKQSFDQLAGFEPKLLK